MEGGCFSTQSSVLESGPLIERKRKQSPSIDETRGELVNTKQRNISRSAGLSELMSCQGFSSVQNNLVKDDKAKTSSKCFHGDKNYIRTLFPLGNRKTINKNKTQWCLIRVDRTVYLALRGRFIDKRDIFYPPPEHTHVHTDAARAQKITNMRFEWAREITNML